MEGAGEEAVVVCGGIRVACGGYGVYGEVEVELVEVHFYEVRGSAWVSGAVRCGEWRLTGVRCSVVRVRTDMGWEETQHPMTSKKKPLNQM